MASLPSRGPDREQEQKNREFAKMKQVNPSVQYWPCSRSYLYLDPATISQILSSPWHYTLALVPCIVILALQDLLAAQQDALASSKSEMAERVATNKEIAQLQVGDDGTDRRVSG